MFSRKNNQHAARGSTSGTDDSHKGIKSQHWFQKLLRVLQALSAIVSLALFSARVVKILRLTRKLSQSNGAVEGILAVAVAYTVLLTLVQLYTRAGGANVLRWIAMVLDILFVGAFIAVAVETRPNGGPSGPCVAAVRQVQRDSDCQLPSGTFVLAIVSTILHFITALYHTIRNRRQNTRDKNEKHQAATAISGEAYYST